MQTVFKKGFNFCVSQIIKTGWFNDFFTSSQTHENDSKSLFKLLSNSSLIEGHSQAQLKQDIFVLLLKDFKKNGFFVEFGATNGVELSNTHLLEKSYGWTGILAEPDAQWHEALSENRAAQIEHACVWKCSGESLKFSSVENAEYSTISTFVGDDVHSEKRKGCAEYTVPSISLVDLLKKHNAPKTIDYLSIDTEGSEFEILRAFDFNAYHIDIITCEHNFSARREDIYQLLLGNGYRRVFTSLSQVDDWYIRN